MKVNLVFRTPSKLNEAALRKDLRWLISELNRRKILKKRHAKKSLVIALLSNKESQKLNKQFRGRNRPTDVLSFAPIDKKNVGELGVAIAVVKRQAKEHRQTVRDECFYVILHGVLHLLGYDHERSARDAKKMFALQDSIFAKYLQT